MFCINIYEQFSAKTQMSALTNVLHFLQKLTLCHNPGENPLVSGQNIKFFLPLFVCQIHWKVFDNISTYVRGLNP